MGAPGFLSNQRVVEHLSAALRSSLGGDTFAAALQRGRRRTARDVLPFLTM